MTQRWGVLLYGLAVSAIIVIEIGVGRLNGWVAALSVSVLVAYWVIAWCRERSDRDALAISYVIATGDAQAEDDSAESVASA